MELFDAIAKRYSVRAFQDRPVDEPALQEILAAANAAPSAGNLQAFEIVVVREPGRRRQLAAAAYDQGFVAQAPVVLVFVTNPARNRKYGPRGAELYTIQDATVACAYAQLAATAHGLGTCWVGAFDPAAVARVVSAAADGRPVAILPIGWPSEPARPRERRALTDLLRPEQWQKETER